MGDSYKPVCGKCQREISNEVVFSVRPVKIEVEGTKQTVIDSRFSKYICFDCMVE